MSLTVVKTGVDSSVRALPLKKRISGADAESLARLGIETIGELLLALPFDWESYGEPVSIADLRPGQSATVIGTIRTIRSRRPIRASHIKWITEATLDDGSDESLALVWFNQEFVRKSVLEGTRLAVAGLVKERRYGGAQMSNPHFEVLDTDVDDAPKRVGGLMPKYHLVKGLTSKKIARWVEAALPFADQLEDVLPEDVRRRHSLLPIASAVRQGHQPETNEQYREAKRRMVFEELFELQTAFALMRARQATEPATPVPYRQDVIDAFKAGLGFDLTNAQRRATWDAFQDMRRAVPMNRLLNGDVGSGKTAVAAACVAMAHAAGMQSVVMAPTEILARQHLGKFRAYLEERFPDLKVELLVSDLPAAERRRVRMAAASGHCALLVGTHALIEDDVEFSQLGLAVVDEQHRFGTRQRELLRAKGSGRPHFLAMTATPIPRTLALAVYGEMAVSVIDELPPGRTPIVTRVVEPTRRQDAYELVRNQIAQGRQAFVIYPLIDESEKSAGKAAAVEVERLQRDVFPQLKLGLVHGRLKEKDEVMRRFVAGEIQVLVATTVVEVGVDVPNASVMMVEGADRFGLAQLHQLRGRVGRGAAKSYCLLLADDATGTVIERLSLVESTTDGFKLAEEDMRLRGMGELMGPRQHGMSDLAMQGLRQPELLSEVRQEAERVLESDPDLSHHPLVAGAVNRRLELTSIS